ncbi:hypothetical protein [Schumannella sp. 10F1B-5-1]|uniref:hypothetical protein n=1 Tax=Schumannella sp. 10F1B-5-1 TaxID=2590780 RepID=UPI001130667D|nr:hypothetical protein [Schumannella sp. 10F1B-5-1]TPW72893.1 hypothetical protein FJ658_06440 [Schumannella sp. 10F1B-5-1]
MTIEYKIQYSGTAGYFLGAFAHAAGAANEETLQWRGREVGWQRSIWSWTEIDDRDDTWTTQVDASRFAAMLSTLPLTFDDPSELVLSTWPGEIDLVAGPSGSPDASRDSVEADDAAEAAGSTAEEER